ncbi:MAG: YCF48-related protein, partial [Kiritimatiellae bacterium]|nr:YCF48-related protein [Kiritimatiellia bacterium]
SKVSGSSAVYGTSGAPAGVQVEKTPTVDDGFVDDSGEDPVSCLRITLGGETNAPTALQTLSLSGALGGMTSGSELAVNDETVIDSGDATGSWGIYYTNGPVDLSDMRYLAFSICAAEPSVKIEIEAPKGKQKKMSLGDMGWDPELSGEWQDITVPLSSFGFARAPSAVYSPFYATFTLPDRYAMASLDGETIWVACSQGIVLKSINGGASWKAQCIDKSQPSLIAVSFVDDANGWCGSSLGYVYKTQDGGATWAKTSHRFRMLSHLQFVNADVGFAADSRGFYRTDNGGQSWQTMTSPNMSLKKVYFLDEQTGWLCGSDGVMKTEDGGESWITQLQPEETGIVDIAMLSESIGYCTDRSAVYATEDGGATWQAVSAPAESFLPECLAWSDAQHGVVGGYDASGTLRVYETANGGRTWNGGQSISAKTVGEGYLLFDLFFDGSHAVLAGAKGSLYHSVGRTEGSFTWADAFPECRELLLKNIRWTE